ncbi:MAG: glycosyltransferase family 2 protein [Acidobacteria bacterium]|nr:glycosyltransferase family 2 protein [Acidobacteriota bacterium]
MGRIPARPPGPAAPPGAPPDGDGLSASRRPPAEIWFGTPAPFLGTPVDAVRAAGRGTPAISVVVPLLNEAPTLRALHEQVGRVLDAGSAPWEILFVDDGSSDTSPDELVSIARKDDRVRILRLRRHFGKAAALSVGLREAAGRIVVTMDADLQDDPAEIPALVEKLTGGYDLVSGWKERRRDSQVRVAASRVFNWATGRLSGLRIHDGNCGLKAYTAECARELAPACRGELHRYLPVLANARGFRIGEIPVRHRERSQGRSRYGVERYARAALDLLATTFATRYGARPMHLLGGLGALAAIAACAIAGSAAAGLGPPAALLGAAAFFGVAALNLVLAGLLAEILAGSRDGRVPYSRVLVLPESGNSAQASKEWP